MSVPQTLILGIGVVALSILGLTHEQRIAALEASQKITGALPADDGAVSIASPIASEFHSKGSSSVSISGDGNLMNWEKLMGRISVTKTGRFGITLVFDRSPESCSFFNVTSPNAVTSQQPNQGNTVHLFGIAVRGDEIDYWCVPKDGQITSVTIPLANPPLGHNVISLPPANQRP